MIYHDDGNFFDPASIGEPRRCRQGGDGKAVVSCRAAALCVLRVRGVGLVGPSVSPVIPRSQEPSWRPRYAAGRSFLLHVEVSYALDNSYSAGRLRGRGRILGSACWSPGGRCRAARHRCSTGSAPDRVSVGSPRAAIGNSTGAFNVPDSLDEDVRIASCRRSPT